MSTLAVTYINGYVVSTIDRDSSAMVVQARYAETLCWEWDEKTKKRGALVAQDEAGEGSLRAHQQMVMRIHETGSPDQKTESPLGGEPSKTKITQAEIDRFFDPDGDGAP